MLPPPSAPSLESCRNILNRFAGFFGHCHCWNIAVVFGVHQIDIDSICRILRRYKYNCMYYKPENNINNTLQKKKEIQRAEAETP